MGGGDSQSESSGALAMAENSVGENFQLAQSFPSAIILVL
jgi:hypothetical protein